MTKINSLQEPCSKCQKKYSQNLENWTPCKNCPWVAKAQDLKTEKERISSGVEKSCIECEEILNFLEPEKDKYLCGKVKCLRSYIQRKSKENKS